MSIENIDVASPRLLILTRRDPTCIFFSLFITTLRLTRGKVTHVSLIDYLFEPIVEDLLQHYDNVLLLDIANEFNINTISRKNVSALNIDLKTLLDSKDLVKESEQNSKILLEISTVMYLIEHPENVLDNVDSSITILEKIDKPPLPGCTYLDIIKSIVLSVMPYIPEVTGSDNISLDSHDFENILRIVSEKVLKNRFLGTMLDTLLYPSYKVRDGALVQDIMLILESHLWRDEYINIMDIVRYDKALSDRKILERCLSYVKDLSNNVQKVLKSKDYAIDVNNMVMFYRLCKILRFHRKWKEIKIMCRPRRGVICSASGVKPEINVKEYSLYSKDGVYVICYEE
ncbi:MAG: hypothetical protein GXO26_06330 [Crenarchaeota archaeon]|nr:hypothetical protein [Thermoproteota archaeon]